MAEAERTAAPVIIRAGAREGFEDVEIPGIGSLSVAIPRGPFMSGGTTADVALFRALEVYPALRVDVMKQVAKVVKDAIPDNSTGRHKLNDVLRLLGDAKPLAQGAYGVVIAVCLSNAVAELAKGARLPPVRPYRDSRCWKIKVAGKGAARGTGAELFLQMAMKVQNIDKAAFGNDFKKAAYAHPTRLRGAKYVAHENPWREVLMGRAANLMVQANITPHTVLFYSAYLVDDVPASRAAKGGKTCSILAEAITHPTDECIDPSTVACGKEDPAPGGVVVGPFAPGGKCPKGFVALRGKEYGLTSIQEWSDFHAEKFVTEMAGPGTAVDVYRSMTVQIMQGLLAFQMHLGLVHSDFHGENAMANVVAHTDVAYLVPRMWDGKRLPNKSDPVDVYVVPTHGYLWKVMDLGMSSSNALFGETDVMDNAMKANWEYMQGWANEATQPEASRVSFDLFDITRFISYLYTEMAGEEIIARTRGGGALESVDYDDVERVTAIERTAAPGKAKASREALVFMRGLLNEAEHLSTTNGMRLETGLGVPPPKSRSRAAEESKDGDAPVRTADIVSKAHEFFEVSKSANGTTGELMPVYRKAVSRRDAFIHTLFTGRLLRLFTFAAAPYKIASQSEIPAGTPVFDMRNRMATHELSGLEARFYRGGAERGTFTKLLDAKPRKATRRR